jgi:hypothetical protein
MHKLLWASLIVLFAATAVAQPAGRESTAEANKTVVNRAFAALNDGDLKTLNGLFDPVGPLVRRGARRAFYRRQANAD